MHNYYLRLYCFLAITISFNVFAQTTPNNQGFGANGVFVQAIKSKSATGTPYTGNVVSMQQFRVTNGTAPLKYYDRAVAYNRAQYGAKVKGIIKANALNVAIIGVTVGLGYFLDYATGDLYKQPPEPEQTCSTGKYVSAYDGYESCALSTNLAHNKKYWQNSLTPSGYGYCCFSFSYYNLASENPTGQYNFEFEARYSNNGAQSFQTYIGTDTITHHPTQNNKQNQPSEYPFGDESLADWYLENATPEQKNEPFINPYNKAVSRDAVNAQSEKDLYNEIAPTIGKAVSSTAPVTPPAINLQPSPNYDMEVTNNQTSESTSIEFPNFCTWASVVCEAIDWIKDTGDEPVDADYKFSDSIETVDINQVNYNSGLSGGQCPSPKSYSILGTSQTLSYQPMCDLASIARIFVLLGAYLASCYIVLGVKK